jgi:ABC-type Fe3+/spermidine/putrescine transport system ATPase subunit
MSHLISVNNLHKSYGEAIAIRGISFDVEVSELTAIIGPSGCGKSTLLRCLNGLEIFDSGRVRIGQRPFASRIQHSAPAFARGGRDGLSKLQPLSALDRAGKRDARADGG